MANPQREKGHLDIANDINDALASTQLSGYESRVLWTLFRKTWGQVVRDRKGKIINDKVGWPVKVQLAVILSKNWIEATGLNKQNISRTLRSLILRRIIIRYHKKKKVFWGFQKNYDLWLPPILEVVIKNDNTFFKTKENQCYQVLPNSEKVVIKNDNRGFCYQIRLQQLSKMITPVIKIDYKSMPKPVPKKQQRASKKVLQESTTRKKRRGTKYIFSQLHLKLTDLLITLIKQNKPDRIFKGSNYRERWANDIRLTEQVDKRSIDRIRKVIEFSQRDSFWKQNILSGSTLRKQFDRLELKCQEEKNDKQSRQHYRTDRSRKEDKYKDLYEV